MKYLFCEDILIIHEKIINETGGMHGVRDVHLLRSIVERPKMQFGGKDLYPTIFDKAAAYFDSCAFHHVFVDGNKRTAVLLVANFLDMNDHSFDPKQKEILNFTLKTVEFKYEFQKISSWIKKHSRKIKK